MNLCPVCGFPGLEEPAYDGFGCASFEICPSCGNEFGYDDFSRSHAELRHAWLAAGALWWCRAQAPPAGWSAREQLDRAGLPVGPLEGFTCGVEEPLGCNEQLYGLREETGELVLGTSAHTGLHRYGFVRVGDADTAPAGMNRLLDYVRGTCPGPELWVETWGVPPRATGRPRELIVSRGEELRREAEGRGASLLTAGPVTVAGWAYGPDAAPELGLEQIRGRALRRFLIFRGELPALAELLEPPFRATFEQYACSGTAAIGPAFLDWLAQRDTWVLYPAKDLVARPGLVAVGRTRLEVTPLVREGSVVRAFHGPAASDVWRLSPSFGN